MALHYNLAKVYEISSDDADFVHQILMLFFKEVSSEIQNIKQGINEKNHKKVYKAAHKIKPTLDLLGMDLAYEEINEIMIWAKSEKKKKEIKENFKLLKVQIELSSKEIKKNYNIK